MYFNTGCGSQPSIPPGSANVIHVFTWRTADYGYMRLYGSAGQSPCVWAWIAAS